MYSMENYYNRLVASLLTPFRAANKHLFKFRRFVN